MKIFGQMERNDKEGRDRIVTLGANNELLITINVGSKEDSRRFLELVVWYGKDGEFHYSFDSTKTKSG